MAAEQPGSSAIDACLAGGFGGACLCIVGAPFDVVKVRQQTEPLGALRVVNSILRSEGAAGLWRGVTPPLLASVPQWAIVFGTYDHARLALRRWSGRPKDDVRDTAIAGALVAIPTSFIYTPVDRVKCTLQADGRRIAAGRAARYASAADCARALWRDGGLPSLYRGYWATLARDVPAWATYFAVYTLAKRALGGDAVLDGRAELAPLASLAAGGLAGSATWAVCIPIDAVKTTFQTEVAHASYRAACAAMHRAAGWRGFFAGFGAIVLGGVPRDSACLTGTEVAQRALTLWRGRSAAAS